MLTETVANIILDARRLVDGETTSTTSDLETDAELIRYLNRAYKQLVGDVIRFGGHDLLLTYQDITGPTYTHDAVMRPFALEVPVASGEWIQLRQFTFKERNRHSNTDFPAWRWMPGTAAAGQLQFFPTTAAPASLRFWYIEELTAYTTANEAVATLLGFDAYLSARIAMMMLAKEQRHSAEIKEEFEIARAMVREACRDINPVEPDRVAALHRVPEDYLDEGIENLELLPRQ